jgi:hypothetical protein
MQIPNPRMRSVLKHDFSSIPHADIPRSVFNRSHGIKTAFDSSYLIPIYCDECLPGDSFNLTMHSICRLATPLYPIMDNIRLDFFFFFVPNRLLWSNWEKFMGAQDDPGDSIDFTIPTVSGGAGFAEDSLYDYFGIPTGISGLTVNNLHGRAYNLIWNEWFRSQDLQDSLTVDTGDGPDTLADYVLQKRGKRHDYFTSALPNPQRGSTAISLPLGTEAPIFGDNMDFDGVEDSSNYAQIRDAAGGSANLRRLSVNGTYLCGASNSSGSGELKADLSGATAADINDIREAFQLQKVLERDARGGTRYCEIVQSHFGVYDPAMHAILQRPQYLGGGTTTVNIQPIANTSDDGTNKQGDLTAIGYQTSSGIGFTHSFTEHGVLLGLVCATADQNYQQGIDRMWSRQTRYDYYLPALAHLGEQSILKQEIFAQGTSVDDEVFGYIPRWDEYRHKNSKITGVLRSDHSGAIDHVHLAQDYASVPSLNSAFIVDATPMSRVVAVPSEPEFIFDGHIELYCTRPMPSMSIPGYIDHF